LPILFLGKFSGTKSAYFERGYYLGVLPNTFLLPINSKISYAFYAKLKDQLDRVKKGVHLNISFSYRLVLPITIIAIIFSKEIVLLIYGEQWIEVAGYFKYLAGLFILSPLFAILKFFLISHDGIDAVFKSRIYSLIALILGIFLIYHFSLDFKYIALLLSIIYFFSFIYLIVFTNKKLKMDLKELFLKPSFIAILLIPVLLIPKLYWMIISLFYLLLYLSILIISEKESLIEIIYLLMGSRHKKKSNYNKT
jgi:O-antigen/teichoic acid export membrane protein